MPHIERDTWRRIESATRTTERQIRTSHRRVTPPIRAGGSKTLVAKFDGEQSGKRYTGHLWNDDGTQGAAIQWLFDWGNDPGTDTLVTVDVDFVEVEKCPTWLASNAAYGAVATYGEKYVAKTPIWGAIS
jgi:hypothetical protein